MNDAGTATHFLNGRLVKEGELVVSVRDLGFMRGFAVFDFLITYNGQKPFYLDRHIDRLFRSAELIGLAVPWSKEQVHEWVMQALAANADGGEKAIKIVLSGGASHTLLPETQPTIAILIDPRKDYEFPGTHYTEGVAVVTDKFRRYAPEAKSNNYIEGVKKAQEAAKQGAIETVYYDDAQVYEGSTCNIFAVIGGKLVTPKSNILGGVTRAVLLEVLPSAGIPAEERDFSFDELKGASEMFLAASNKEVMPVAHMDGAPIGNGMPGPVTKEVMKAFRDFVLSGKW